MKIEYPQGWEAECEKAALKAAEEASGAVLLPCPIAAAVWNGGQYQPDIEYSARLANGHCPRRKAVYDALITAARESEAERHAVALERIFATPVIELADYYDEMERRNPNYSRPMKKAKKPSKAALEVVALKARIAALEAELATIKAAPWIAEAENLEPSPVRIYQPADCGLAALHHRRKRAYA
jgi:hypothetical protein